MGLQEIPETKKQEFGNAGLSTLSESTLSKVYGSINLPQKAKQLFLVPLPPLQR